MIAINGKILENRYTTAQWAAITTILPDRVWGHEVDSDGTPIGSKMGDGINLWSALPYWYFGGAGAIIEEPITTGTSFSYAYDGRFGDNPTAYIQYDTGTGWKTVGWADIMDDGSILAEGDFTSGTWVLIVKP